MKYTITCIILLQAIYMQAQNIDALTGKIWAVQEQYVLHEESGKRTDLYNFNSENELNNKFDGFKYDFQTSGTLLVTLESATETKTWAFSNSGNSFSINDASYEVVSLTTEEFIVRNSVEKYGVELNYYLKLGSVQSLSNGAFNLNNYLDVYPNPASDVLNLKFDNAIINNLKELVVIDVMGKNIMTSALSNNSLQEISVNSLSKGVYFAKIIDNSNTTVAIKKFIVNN
ncbi:T9SS type A sorting domain-containing protein [Algibacter sp. AS12]|uniref:T9SS type A sorting domain-containing protein n=1 Tax=Algibacter sp. AS12 TaxID=3135773 RepID=UPI00398B3021